jgi:hypothetical protein
VILFGEALQTLRCVGERIDTGSCLIEDEDSRILKQHARQGNQLALPHGDPFSLFSDWC